LADYLKEKHLVEIVLRYRDNKKKADEFISAISLIANNLMRKYKFYSSGMGKEDFIQEAVMICLQKQHCYQLDKGSCFSYFTTVILNHWKYTWNLDRRYYDLIEALMEKLKETNGL
jgi:hypothetical protein